jgi:hypothetical protein
MDKLAVLQLQKEKLALQLEEKRRENRALEEKLEGLEAKQQEYAHTMLCVGRVWDQLNTDVATLIADIGGDAAVGAADQQQGGSSSRWGAIAAHDPYLGVLLSGADAPTLAATHSAIADIKDELSEVEARLEERAAGSKRALGRLLTCVRQLQASSATVSQAPEVAQAPQEGVEGQGAAAGTAVQDNAAAQRFQAMQSALDAQAGLRRALEAQLRLSNDRLLEANERVRVVEAEAADHQQALSSAQRKLAALQQRQQEAAAAAVAAAAAPEGPVAPSGGLTSAASIAIATAASLPAAADSLPRTTSGALLLQPLAGDGTNGPHTAVGGGGGGALLGAASVQPPQTQIQAAASVEESTEELAALLARRTTELDNERDAHAATTR